MKNLLEQKIKTEFEKKENFSKHINVDKRDLSKKMRTAENKFNWLKEFLAPLNLEIIIQSKKNK